MGRGELSPGRGKGATRAQRARQRKCQDALGEAERDQPTQETGEDRRRAGSETKRRERAGEAQPQTRKRRQQQKPRRGGVRSQARPGIPPFTRPGDKDADSWRGLLPELVSVGPERAWRVSLGLPRTRGGLKLIEIPLVSATPRAPDKGLGERGLVLSQGWSTALVELVSPPWGPQATVYLTWRPLEGHHPPPKEHSGFPILRLLGQTPCPDFPTSGNQDWTSERNSVMWRRGPQPQILCHSLPLPAQ